MVQQSPRDMRDWIKIVNRKLAQAQGVPSLIATKMVEIRDEVKESLKQRPTFPVELTYQTALYINHRGVPQSRVVIDFPDVTKTTAGDDVEIKTYELWGMDDTAGILAGTSSAVPGVALPGITLPGLVATPQNQAIENAPKPWGIVATSAQSFFRADNFDPGSWWRFRIRAIGVTTIEPGDWSAEIVVQMAPDASPPPQATAPTVTADRGVLTIKWDGMSVLGTMPADFKYAILAHGTESSPTTEIARFDRGGGFKILSAPYYTPQFFRVRALDESGNEGPWSEQAVGITTPLVDTDVILSEIDAAVTHLKNIDAGVSILPDTIISEHIVVTESLTGRMAQFLHLKAGQIDVNDLWADTAFFGLADAKLVRSDMFEGKEFHGGKFVGAEFDTDIEEYTGVKWDTSGITAWNPGGQQTFHLNALTGRAQITGRVSTGPIGSAGAVLMPAEESSNGSTTGLFITSDGALTGLVTAGMYVANGYSSGPESLHVRGLNLGEISLDATAVRLPWNNARIGNFASWAIGSGQNYLPNLEVLDGLKLTNVPTTSAAANAVIAVTPNGVVYRSTSSLRYKTDVQDWAPEYRALGLRARSWVDRTPMDPAEPLQRYYGFVAEEVHEVLPEMVTLNDYGEPESVQYERIAASYLPIIQDLVRRIDILEGK